MLTFLLRLFYSHVVPCRGSLSECLRCWCWMYPTTHNGLHPAEGNSTLKNWQWALTDLTVEADPPQLVFTQIWRNHSPREYTVKKKSNAILSLPYKACFMWCERYYLYKGRLHDILNCWYMTRAVDPWVHSALGNVWILRITKHYKHTNKQNAFVRFCNGFLIFKRPLHSQSQFSG